MQKVPKVGCYYVINMYHSKSNAEGISLWDKHYLMKIEKHS